MSEGSDPDPSGPWSVDKVFKPSKFIFWLVILFVIGVLIHFLAAFYHYTGIEEYIAVLHIVIVVVAIVGIAALFSPKTAEKDKPKDKESGQWLIRLVVVTALGMCVVVLYSMQWIGTNATRIASIGLLTAGATWLIGVVVGFLFGIPHTRQGDPTKSSNSQPNQDSTAAQTSDASAPQPKTTDTAAQTSRSQADADKTRDDCDHYSANTNLEQISDWLTKIIVGVGLTKFGVIPGKLESVASFIAAGMGNEPSHKPFALFVCVYFMSSGFLFGFLWARLLMGRAFRSADR